MSGGEGSTTADRGRRHVYVTMQELATRISHRNTGTKITDPAGFEIMKRVAIDENHHFLFYRDIAIAGFKLDPSGMVKALERQLIGFAMPGTGIPDFTSHAKAIAAAGIYDFTSHYKQIIEPVVLRDWNLAGIEGLDGEAQAAQERIMAFVQKQQRVSEKLEARREKKAAQSDLVGASAQP